MARVAVLFTGGTISMRQVEQGGGAVPTLDGAALLATVPGLEAIAEVEPIDWGLVPASHLSFAQLLELAGLLRAALARPEIEGAVVVQGTDVIDETAFAFDLLVPGHKPVVVTGAMRNAGEDGYEGPLNLRAAVRCAAAPDLRGQGALVVLGGRILPADDALKVHTTAYAAFEAPNDGPLGAVTDEAVHVTRQRLGRRALAPLPDRAAEPIPLLTAHIASDGALLRLAQRDGARGFVVAATGSGNTHPDLLAAAREAMAAGTPVALASRCGAGGVRPAYGFPGGSLTWARAGALLAGTLSGPKARIALALGLGAGLDEPGLRALLAG
ncbi:MAG: asparaginase [Candidatus Limnocylindrales bacterium]